MKWYPADWRADPRLRMCSLAARGLWADLLSYMHEGTPYGHLTIDGVKPDMQGISSLVGRPIGEVRKAMAELESRQVFSRDEAGAIFSRRMVRDKAKAERDSTNGKEGGNPQLTGAVKRGVNPPVNGGDKAHMPETRNQKEEEKEDAASAALDPSIDQRDYYRRGKQVCGETAGGMLKNLLKAKGGNTALARSVVEVASTKQNAREYVAAAVHGPPSQSRPPDV